MSLFWLFPYETDRVRPETSSVSFAAEFPALRRELSAEWVRSKRLLNGKLGGKTAAPDVVPAPSGKIEMHGKYNATCFY